MSSFPPSRCGFNGVKSPRRPVQAIGPTERCRRQLDLKREGLGAGGGSGLGSGSRRRPKKSVLNSARSTIRGIEGIVAMPGNVDRDRRGGADEFIHPQKPPARLIAQDGQRPTTRRASVFTCTSRSCAFPRPTPGRIDGRRRRPDERESVARKLRVESRESRAGSGELGVGWRRGVVFRCRRGQGLLEIDGQADLAAAGVLQQDVPAG